MSVRGTLLPALMLLIGLAIIVRTIVLGGGPVAAGVILGVLFCVAGGLRLWAESKL